MDCERRQIHISPSYKHKEHLLVCVYSSIIDKYSFRQQANRERQQTSMQLLWWTASTVRFSVSMCLVCDVSTASATGAWRRKKMSEQERENMWEREGERENEQWAQVGPTSAFTSCLFFLKWGSEERGEEKRRGVCVCVCVAWRNKCEMKVFLEATKKLYTGKRPGKPWMGLKNTDKTWEGRRHVLQWHRAPCLVQRGSQKHRKRRSAKDIMEMMDLLGNIVVVTVGAKLVYILGKRPLSFLSSSFENKVCRTDRRSQTVSGCAVDFVVGPTGAPCVALCKKSDWKKGEKDESWDKNRKEGEIRRTVGKTSEESWWERKWEWKGDALLMMSDCCYSETDNYNS